MAGIIRLIVGFTLSSQGTVEIESSKVVDLIYPYKNSFISNKPKGLSLKPSISSERMNVSNLLLRKHIGLTDQGRKVELDLWTAKKCHWQRFVALRGSDLWAYEYVRQFL